LEHFIAISVVFQEKLQKRKQKIERKVQILLVLSPTSIKAKHKVNQKHNEKTLTNYYHDYVPLPLYHKQTTRAARSLRSRRKGKRKGREKDKHVEDGEQGSVSPSRIRKYHHKRGN
jgi:hypothetical protein